MLQQTQAARVVDPYLAFLRRFPTVSALACARPADVLRAWGSLGYNRRALDLWRAAQLVDADGFPRTVADLDALPGIGAYTARAVASFAFGADVGVVDANVRRVLTRVYALPPDADVQPLADRLTPRGRSAAWNQSMIDFGAVVCRARTPSCSDCPLWRSCGWRSGRRPQGRVRAPAPAFVTTSRYARGRIVGALRRSRHPLQRGSLRRTTGLTARRFDAAMRSLERDGMISLRGEKVALGPSGREREARRRR